MPGLESSTVAQILLEPGETCDLRALVADLDRALKLRLGSGHGLAWDTDDTAFLDAGPLRVVVNRTGLPLDGPVERLCLSISAGTVPGTHADMPQGARHAEIARLLVDRLARHLTPDAVRWQEVGRGMTAELMDDLLEAIPAAAVARPAPRPLPPSARSVASTAEQAVLRDIRDAIHVRPDPMADDAASIRMRVAATAMASTVTLVALPVGAALLTYSLFRGADVRLSGHVLAVTGLFMALAQTPAAQGLLAPFI